MKKEMLINVLQPEECRIAIVEDGVLEELYVERSSQESYVGNIYKGRIVNIEPSIQAAFVDFGIGRNGFLHVSDVDPAYYKHLLSREALAEYEEEMNREFGGGGGRSDRGDRGRDSRGDRGGRGGRERDRDRPPQPMRSFLPREPVAPAEPMEAGDFAVGLVDGEDAAAFIAGVEDIAQPPTLLPVTPTQPTPLRRAVPPPPPPRDDEEADEFGEGLIEGKHAPDESESFSGELEVEETEAEPTIDAAVEIVEAVTEEAGVVIGDLPEGAEEPKARKSRGRKPRAKADEPPAEPESGDTTAEGKTKGRTRRPRKKGEGDAGDEGASGEAPPDDKPKYMGSAERRTSPADDEPEVRSFFEGIPTDDFDPDAPNDRFADAEQSSTASDENAFAEDATEPSSESDDAADFPSEDPEPVEPDSSPEPVVTGRGFNDDFDDQRAERDRNRGGDRGDRGGRGRGGNRDRDRDRGPRYERGPGRDRGPGGPRGGPRMGPGGPKGGRDRGLPKPPIQEIFKRGQEVIVQVIKEGIGTKGPTLSTYISIAGRYLVLMPSLSRVGVSRKIEDHDARRRLREIMTTLGPPKGVGFIVRTAAIDRDAAELRNDLAYLLRLWQVVVRRVKRVNGPCEIYRESDLITRTIRDIFTADIDTIWVDEATAFSHASEFLQIVMPRYASRIRHFENTEPLFHKYAIEDEIAKIHQKRIEMPLGGSLIIEQTEALVAIDVNSGNFRADNQNAEETAYQMNLHAAKEIARQLRLRDLGGVIVNDFIDMRSESHRRNVEAALRNAMQRDRARTKILRISQFGIIEMTRQRIRPSLKRSIFADCPHCRGTGFVKNNESMSIEVMRMIQLAAHRSPAISMIELTVHVEAANYLLNKKRREIALLEERAGMQVQITGQNGVSPDLCLVKCLDQNGNEVRLLPQPPLPRLQGGRYPRGNDRGGDRRYPQPLE